MKIWKTSPTVAQLNEINSKTIHESLGILFSDIGDDYMEATMPVDHRTHQPHGLLHGGASVVLAESLGSVASMLVIGQGGSAVGIEVSASHINKVKSGMVTGRVTPIKIGKFLHVWDIQIRDGADINSKVTCKSRLTVMVKEK